MKNSEDKQLSASEAAVALANVAAVERSENANIRPALWLNIVISASYGALTTTWAQMAYHGGISVSFTLSISLFFSTLAYYLISSRKKGFMPKLMPKTTSELKFNLILAVIFAGTLIISREACYQGYAWAARSG